MRNELLEYKAYLEFLFSQGYILEIEYLIDDFFKDNKLPTIKIKYKFSHFLIY